MNKRMLKKVMMLLLSMVLLTAVFSACVQLPADSDKTSGTGEDKTADVSPTTPPKAEEKPPAKKIELRFATNSTTSAADFEEMNAAIAEFEAKNPNVKIVKDAVDTQTWRTKISVEFFSNNAPNVSWCPLNYAIQFMQDDLIIDWSKVFDDPKHPEFKLWFNDTARNFSDYGDGRLMLCPSVASIDGLFYNAELFEKNGWQPPKTIDDLIDLAAKCKEKGISAMVTGGKDTRYAWMAAAIQSRTSGIENMKYLASGEGLLKWSDPQYGFPQAMEAFKRMCDAGVFPKDTNGLSAAEADQLFVREEAAMYYEGQWKVANWKSAGGEEFINKVKRIDFPSIPGMSVPQDVRIGGTVTGYVIIKNQSEEEISACIDFVKKIVSPEFFRPLMEKGFLYAGELDLTGLKLDPVTVELIEAFQTAKHMVGSNDSAFLHPSIDMVIKKTAMPGLVDQTLTLEEAIDAVKKTAEDLYNESK